MGTIYELEKRLSNLENLVDYLSKQMTSIKEYSDADMAGARQNISDVTPNTYTKQAYIGDMEVVFDNVSDGNITVYAEDTEGNHPYYVMLKREQNKVTVLYANPFEYVTKITLSII